MTGSPASFYFLFTWSFCFLLVLGQMRTSQALANTVGWRTIACRTKNDLQGIYQLLFNNHDLRFIYNATVIWYKLGVVFMIYRLWTHKQFGWIMWFFPFLLIECPLFYFWNCMENHYSEFLRFDERGKF